MSDDKRWVNAKKLIEAISKCKAELLTDEAKELHNLFTEIIDSLAVEVGSGAIGEIINEYEIHFIDKENDKPKCGFLEFHEIRKDQISKACAELAALKEKRELWKRVAKILVSYLNYYVYEDGEGVDDDWLNIALEQARREEKI